MQHAWARLTIAPLLASPGFGVHALVLGLAADAAAVIPRDLTESLWTGAKDVPPDDATPSIGTHNQLPIPADQSGLVAQLAPLMLANPGDTGLDLALLSLLVELWPHVSSDERPLLRVRFLNGLMERATAVGTRTGMPREAVVTSAELKVWNRYLPTATGEGITAATAHELLLAGSAQEAYTRFTDLLIGGLDQATVSRILGSVALLLVDQRTDQDGILLHPLLGTVAAERLAAIAPPETFAALLSQLAHQVWWAGNHTGLVLRQGEGVPAVDLGETILAGDPGAIRSSVRRQGRDNAHWWQALTPVSQRLAAGTALDRRRAVTGIWALAMRSQGRIIAPDDGLAVALLLADGRTT